MKQNEQKTQHGQPAKRDTGSRNHPVIVKYHNDLSKVSFAELEGVEQNIFMYFLAAFKDHGDTELVFTYDDIIKKAGIKSTDKRRVHKQIERIGDVLMDKSILVSHPNPEMSGTTIRFHMFDTYIQSDEAQKIVVKIDSRFLYLINHLGELNMFGKRESFTQFELEEHNEIRGKYAKHCYRLLKRFRDTGQWIVSIEEFRALLGITDRYLESKRLKARVITPVVEELGEYFEDLSVDYIKDETKKGKPIKGIKFTFKKQKNASADTLSGAADIPAGAAEGTSELTPKTSIYGDKPLSKEKEREAIEALGFDAIDKKAVTEDDYLPESLRNAHILEPSSYEVLSTEEDSQVAAEAKNLSTKKVAKEEKPAQLKMTEDLLDW